MNSFRPKIHIENAPKPFLIDEYISIVDRENFKDFNELEEYAKQQGYELGDSNKNISSTLQRLGILKNGSSTELTSRGEALADILMFDERLFNNLLHYIYASSFDECPSHRTMISWSYIEISKYLYEEAPIEDFNSEKDQIIDHMMLKARDMAGKEGFHKDESDTPAFGPKSVNGYRNYIKALSPSVMDDQRTFKLRNYVPVQLALLAINYLYISRETVNYGDTIELTEEVKRDLGIITLVKPEKIDKMIENADKNYSDIEIISGYNLKVKLNAEVNFNKFS